MTTFKLPPLKTHLCTNCVWGVKCFDKNYRDDDFIGCFMSQIIVAWRPIGVYGQPSVRYFTPVSALNKVITLFMPEKIDGEFKLDFDGEIELKTAAAYRGVSYCERHETLNELLAAHLVGYGDTNEEYRSWDLSRLELADDKTCL